MSPQQFAHTAMSNFRRQRWRSLQIWSSPIPFDLGDFGKEGHRERISRGDFEMRGFPIIVENSEQSAIDGVSSRVDKSIFIIDRRN
jgi:hypothetical protein